MRVAALQMRSTTRPQENAETAVRLVREAIDRGATYIQTPEVTNLVQRNRELADPLVTEEADDATLNALRTVAAEAGVIVHIGSLVVREGDVWRNRAFLIGADGAIVARYDKIHMFDVDLPSGERFRESQTYTAGDCALLADIGELTLGVTICFDLRFPRVYEELAVAGANVLTAPSAFAATTGRDHWHALVRTRAIENGAYMIAATQEGQHEDGRTTYGHSVIVAPWGRVLAEAQTTPSVIVADIDLSLVEEMRRQIPVLSARKLFTVRRVGQSERAAKARLEPLQPAS